ncbi:DUF1127 domain-containing protein [Pikeienuella piscinae]|uniref:DUF1127 domain-containing protein n=1 Tax=Pikeienuella piscinae TaxID=2748098 RepID=A0A7L5C005_9RHOB|nr:DUF1127 domain-containing protein [Pikeienuella piscinae]QIE55846.1 DUF1127 domain-containing protein [Pikeienuella piscinae]
MSIYLTRRMIDPSTPRSAADPERGLLSRLRHAAARRRRRRRTLATLHGLDDRMLADIGLRRSDIPDLVEALNSRELSLAPLTPAPRAEHGDLHAFPQGA